MFFFCPDGITSNPSLTGSNNNNNNNNNNDNDNNNNNNNIYILFKKQEI